MQYFPKMVPMVPHIFQKLIPTIPPSNSINNRMFANLQRDRIDNICTKKLPVNSLKGPRDENVILGNFRLFRLNVLSVPKYHVISFFSYNSNISH